jgi:hypothetical protein
LVELKAPGALLIERLDQTSERYLVDVASEHLLHGKFYDFARWGRDLAAGGLYRISLDAKESCSRSIPVPSPAIRRSSGVCCARLFKINAGS